MPLPMNALVPLSGGVVTLIVALAFLVLWRRHHRSSLSYFALSFAGLGTVRAIRAVDAGIVHLPSVDYINSPIIIFGVGCLLAGCLQHAGRRAPVLLIFAVAALLSLAVIVILALTELPGLQYVPSLTGALYLLIAYVFFSSPVVFGNRLLGGLFLLRGVVNLPWIWLGFDGRAGIYMADQAIVVAIALTLIVSELQRATDQIAAARGDLRRQAEELRALNERLRVESNAAIGANRAKGEFLAHMSHELRTPLNAIMGYSDIIAHRRLGDVPTQYEEYAAIINKAAGHLHGIVQDVLEMSRIDAKCITPELQAISLTEMTDDALAMTGHLAEAQRVAVSVDISAAADKIVADAKFVRQILVNILSNAFKFGEAGGQVSLAADRRQDMIEIQVVDDGIGIKESDLRNIFEPFAIGDSSVARNRGGIGLGLAISRALVELQHGQIGITSEWGKGTTVTVRLPVHVPA